MIAIIEQALDNTAESPHTSLCLLFALYKSLLLAIAFVSPGPGYDTSTQLSGWPELGPLGRLVRWDAIWFTGLAREGYKWEQGWAFGWGYTRLLSLAKSIWPDQSLEASVHREAIWGVFISHFSHLMCTLLLYKISLIVFRKHDKGERIAFVTGCLYVLSPAGIFLSAPYIEAPFAFLQFIALYIYSSAHLRHVEQSGSPVVRDLQIILSGALIGISCMFRGNGIFSGAIYAMDAIEDGLTFIKHRGRYTSIQNLIATVIAGMLVAVGHSFPQYLAYLDYCVKLAEPRPWCSNMPPSIYSYVQEKYWYVGLFQYWSTNSIPLFAMAAPVLTMVYCSSWWAWTVYRNPPKAPAWPLPEEQQPLAGSSRSHEQDPPSPGTRRERITIDYNLLFRFMLPQFIVATVCFFIANVQIITRVGSAYPVWYWWLAVWIVQDATSEEKTPKSRWPGIMVKFFVMYGMIQCCLFASFLPPA